MLGEKRADERLVGDVALKEGPSLARYRAMMPRRNTGAKKSPCACLLFAERQDARSYSVYSCPNPTHGDWRMARDMARGPCPDCPPLQITTIAFVAALLGGSTPVIAARSANRSGR
jgi:hypothetical protein